MIQLQKSLTSKILIDILRISVFVLSVMLIVYISYDTFNQIPFLENTVYMHFQFWVCMVFLLDFFVEWIFAPLKWTYFKRNFFYLFISIPYLNIIQMGNFDFSASEIYFIRFIPLARGAYALALVVGYISSNRISSMFASYIAIMLSIVYFASLIFYQVEFPVNPQVPNYSESLWWAFMNVTTLGAPITPVTDIGKILCVCLGGLGMMMFPLFTVYITNLVTQANKQREAQINAAKNKKSSN